MAAYYGGCHFRRTEMLNAFHGSAIFGFSLKCTVELGPDVTIGLCERVHVVAPPPFKYVIFTFVTAKYIFYSNKSIPLYMFLIL